MSGPKFGRPGSRPRKQRAGLGCGRCSHLFQVAKSTVEPITEVAARSAGSHRDRSAARIGARASPPHTAARARASPPRTAARGSPSIAPWTAWSSTRGRPPDDVATPGCERCCRRARPGARFAASTRTRVLRLGGWPAGVARECPGCGQLVREVGASLLRSMDWVAERGGARNAEFRQNPSARSVASVRATEMRPVADIPQRSPWDTLAGHTADSEDPPLPSTGMCRCTGPWELWQRGGGLATRRRRGPRSWTPWACCCGRTASASHATIRGSFSSAWAMSMQPSAKSASSCRTPRWSGGGVSSSRPRTDSGCAERVRCSLGWGKCMF